MTSRNCGHGSYYGSYCDECSDDSRNASLSRASLQKRTKALIKKELKAFYKQKKKMQKEIDKLEEQVLDDLEEAVKARAEDRSERSEAWSLILEVRKSLIKDGDIEDDF